MLEIFAVNNAQFLGDTSDGLSKYGYQPTLIVFPEEGFEDWLDGYKPGIYKYDNRLESYISDWQTFPSFLNLLAKAILNMSATEIRKARKDPSIRHQPFYEIIDLVHSERRNGTVGPITSRKLVLDFTNYQQLFLKRIEELNPSNKDIFVEIYSELIKQFEYASENGFVVFT